MYIFARFSLVSNIANYIHIITRLHITRENINPSILDKILNCLNSNSVNHPVKCYTLQKILPSATMRCFKEGLLNSFNT